MLDRVAMLVVGTSLGYTIAVGASAHALAVVVLALILMALPVKTDSTA